MKVKNVENGKTAEVSEQLGRHLIGTRNFVASDDDETGKESRTKPAPKKRNPRYNRRDMRAQK